MSNAINLRAQTSVEINTKEAVTKVDVNLSDDDDGFKDHLVQMHVAKRDMVPKSIESSTMAGMISFESR